MSARPSRTGTALVWLATLALPHGPVRDRYRREYLAELRTLTTWRALGYATGVLLTAPRLRAAVADPAHVPLLCRLNLTHKWHLSSTEDGGLFKECARCHKGGEQGLFQLWHYPGDDARRSFNY